MQYDVVGTDRPDDSHRGPSVDAPEGGPFAAILCIDEPIPERSPPPPGGAGGVLFRLNDSFPLPAEPSGDVDEIRMSGSGGSMNVLVMVQVMAPPPADTVMRFPPCSPPSQTQSPAS